MVLFLKHDACRSYVGPCLHGLRELPQLLSARPTPQGIAPWTAISRPVSRRTSWNTTTPRPPFYTCVVLIYTMYLVFVLCGYLARLLQTVRSKFRFVRKELAYPVTHSTALYLCPYTDPTPPTSYNAIQYVFASFLGVAHVRKDDCTQCYTNLRAGVNSSRTRRQNWTPLLAL